MKQKYKESNNNHIYEYKELNFESIAGILILCASSLLFSCIVFIIEIFMSFNNLFSKSSNFKRKQPKKRIQRRNEFSNFYSNSMKRNYVKNLTVIDHDDIIKLKSSVLLTYYEK